MKVADAIVIETLLDEVLTPGRLAAVAERALQLAKVEQDAPETRAQVERRLADTQSALDRLTEAVAAGGESRPSSRRSRPRTAAVAS